MSRSRRSICTQEGAAEDVRGCEIGRDEHVSFMRSGTPNAGSARTSSISREGWRTESFYMSH